MKPPTSLYISGAILIASGLLHAACWIVTGESWEGPISIRKPILFGISTGVTLISLGWILQKLKPTVYDKWLGPLLGGTLLIEVGLISAQYWRGEASHFNHDSPLNLLIDRSITILIVIASFAMLDIARRSFFKLDETPAMKFAIRAGMTFLLISCGLGFFILFYGEHLASRGQSPTTLGDAGVMKFPHGITIHAVQYLPLLVWLTAWIGMPATHQVKAVQFASASFAGFLLFSCWQTFNGLDRFDIRFVGAILLAVALLLACGVVKEIASGWLGRPVKTPTL